MSLNMSRKMRWGCLGGIVAGVVILVATLGASSNARTKAARPSTKAEARRTIVKAAQETQPAGGQSAETTPTPSDEEIIKELQLTPEEAAQMKALSEGELEEKAAAAKAEAQARMAATRAAAPAAAAPATTQPARQPVNPPTTLTPTPGNVGAAPAAPVATTAPATPPQGPQGGTLPRTRRVPVRPSLSRGTDGEPATLPATPKANDNADQGRAPMMVPQKPGQANGTTAGSATPAPNAPPAPAVNPPGPGTPPTVNRSPEGKPDLKPKDNWYLPAEERPYFFTWNNTSVEKACQDFVEMTGLSMIGLSQIDPANKNKQINIQSDKLLTYDQALTTFDRVLGELSLWVVRQQNFLVIRPLTEWYRNIPPERMYGSVEAYRKANLPPWEIATVVYQPKYRSTELLATGAVDIVPINAARTKVVPGTDRIELQGTVFYMEWQLQYLEKTDVKDLDDGRTLVEYPLKHTNSGDAARLLQAIVPPSAGPATLGAQPGAPNMPRPGRGPVSPNPTPGVAAAPADPGSSTGDNIDIQEDTRLNRLLVRASKANQELVKDYLEKYIDIPTNPGNKAELIALKYAEPSQVVDTIRPLLGSGSPMMARPMPVPQPQPGQPPQPQPMPQPMQMTAMGGTAVLMPIAASRSILVKANPDEMVTIKSYIEMLDKEGGSSKYQYITLKHAQAGGVANLLTQAVSGRAASPGQMVFRAVSDPQNDKALVITGEPKDIESARELIDQLDIDPDAGAIERVVELRHTMPTALANILASRFSGSTGQGGGFRGGGGAPSLPRFIGDDRSHNLIILCPEPMWPDIERLVQQIDEKSETKWATKTYKLKNAAAQNLSNVLMQCFRGRPGGDDLTAPNIQFDQHLNALVVTASDEHQERIAAMISDLDQPSPAESAEFKGIELKSADAAYVADKIDDLFQRGGRRGGGQFAEPGKIPINVVPEPLSNRVLVQASPEDFAKAESLAKQIDADYEAKQFVRKVFSPKYVGSGKLERVLMSMFPEAMPNRRGGGGESSAPLIRIAEVGNDLAVMAPKDKMADIEAAITSLDNDPTKDNEIRTYSIKGEPEGAAGLAHTLEQLFGGQQRGERGGNGITFVGDRSGMLIVSAPSDRMKEIDARIQEMLKARGTTDLTFVIKHFDVSQARPEDVADMIAPLLATKYDELQERRGGPSPQVTPHRTANKIMVAAPEALMPLVQDLIKEFDQPASPSTIRMISLKTAKAAEIAPVLEQMMQNRTGRPGFRSSRRSWQQHGHEGGQPQPSSISGGGSGGDEDRLDISAIESSNLLVLRGPEDKVREGEELAAQLDKSALPEGPMFRVIEVKNADVYDVVSMLEDMLGTGEDAWGGGVGEGRRRGGGRSEPVVIRPDSFNRKIFVSAPREKFPMIEEIVQTSERLALALIDNPATVGGDSKGTMIGPGSRGEITMAYSVKGPVDEIAKALDRVLVSFLGYSDAPYIKSLPFANQIVVSGKPAHFKLVEEWLGKLEKDPPKPTIGIVVRQVAPEIAPKLAQAVAQNAPTGVPMTVRPMPGNRKDRLGAIRNIKEVQWNSPIGTQPSPFVPGGALEEMRAELSALTLAQAKMTVGGTRPAAAPTTRPEGAPTTRPSSATPTPVTTRPAAATRPALTAAPVPAPAAAKPQAAAPVNVSSPAKAEPQARASDKSEPAQATGQKPELVGDSSMVESGSYSAIAEAAAAATGGQVQIRYDQDTGQIIMVGPVRQLEEAQTLIDDLIDQFEKLTQGAGDRPIRVFGVNYIDVTIAAAILEQMFNDRTGAQPGQPAQPGKPPQQPPQAGQKPNEKPSEGKDKEGGDEEGAAGRRRRDEAEQKQQEAAARAGGGGERIRIFPDPRTRTLIIRADEKDFPLIAELLLKVDRPGEGSPVDIKIFPIKNLNAFDVEQAIKAILKIDDGTMRGGMMGMRTGMGMNGMGGMPGMGMSPGMGNISQQAMMVERMQRQMLELQGGVLGADIGDKEGDGKLKLNPAKDITLTSDTTTNSVIVSAPKEGMKLVETLIQKLDENPTPVQIQSIQLKNGDAEKVADNLEKIFQGAGRRSGGGSSFRSSMGSMGMMPGMGLGPEGMSGQARLGQELRITADPRTNRLVIRALAADMEKIKPLVDMLDQPSSGEVELYPIEHASATEMATSLSKIYIADAKEGGAARTVRISADAETNTIIVQAPEAQQAMIGLKIKELDGRVEERAVPHQIELKVATPSSVAQKLEAIFVPKGGGQRGVRQRISIEGDDNSGILFVTAPPEVFKDIEKVAGQLDTATRQDIRIIKLKNAYATDVYTLFEKTMSQMVKQLRPGGGMEPFSVTPDPRTNSLIVSGSPAVFLMVDKVLSEIDIVPSDTSAITTAMFGLVKGNAASVAASINQLYAGSIQEGGRQPPRAVPDVTSNVVLVYGTKAQIEQIRTTVVEPLEKFEPSISTIVQDFQIPVKHAKVEEVAEILTKYFQQKAAGARGAGIQAQGPADLAVTVVADPSTRQLLVTCSEKNKGLIDKLLTQMDTPQVTESARQTRVFPLQYAEPNYTTVAITQAFGKTGNVSESEQVKVIPEPGTGSVVVSASPDNMKKIEAMLLDLDKPGNIATRTTPIEIVNADPEDVAIALNEIYTARGRKRSGQAVVTVTVPRGSNRLLVSCSDTDLPEVKALVAQLDQAKGASRDVQIVQVQHLTPDEMAKTLTDFMRRPGKAGASDPSLIGDVKIVASTSANAVVLTGPPDRLKELADVVRRIDSTSPTTQPAGRLVRVIPLKGADPNSVAQVIMQSYTKAGNVAEVDKVTAVAEWTTNSVVINANAAKQDEIGKLIDELDKQPANAPQQAIIALKHARAEDLSNVLTQTFRYGKRARQGDQPIVIQPDANTNSLVVAAGKADLEGIKATVENLDQPALSSIEELRVIPLQYIDAAETLTIMQEYLRKPGGVKGRTGSDLVGDIRLQASQTLNALMVSGSKANLDRVEEIVKGVDKEIPGAGTAPRILKMEHASASMVASTLTRIFSDPSKTGRTGQRAATEMVPLILADESTNSLVIRARTVDYNLIEDMAHKLDTEATGTGDVDIIPVSRSRDVVTLARNLEKIINDGERNRVSQTPGYRPAAVSIGADEQGPALIVAGSPELFKKVRELVTKLDDVRPMDSNNSETRILQPRNLKAADLQKILNQVIQQQKMPNGNGPSRRQ